MLDTVGAVIISWAERPDGVTLSVGAVLSQIALSSNRGK